MENVCHALAREIWGLLTEFSSVMVDSLGKEVNFDWHIEDVMDFKECLHEVESQVRVTLHSLSHKMYSPNTPLHS